MCLIHMGSTLVYLSAQMVTSDAVDFSECCSKKVMFLLTLTVLYLELVMNKLKPQDSFGRFVKFFIDLQKVDHTIRKHH